MTQPPGVEGPTETTGGTGQMPPGVQGPVGTTQLQANIGWNNLTAALRTQGPHFWRQSQAARVGIRKLVRTGR